MAKGRMGGFGSAFAASFTAMLKAIEDERHNKAMEEHYARMDWNAGAEARNLEAARRAGEAGAGAPGTSSAEGGAAVSKNLAANQAEAYNAARAEGLNDSSARALVANMSGEALSDPGNVHKDGPHMAHGIVQWDDVRAARIEKQFGTAPQNMSVTDQTKAAIWEMKTDPAYKASWDALNSDGDVAPKVRTLVANYERPADVGKAVSQRLAFAGRLPTTFKGETAGTAVATTAKPTPSTAAAPSTDLQGKPTDTAPAAGDTSVGKRDDKAKPIPLPANANVASRDGSYKVAGLNTIALSPEDAEKARLDLEAHRAAPDARTDLTSDPDLRPKAPTIDTPATPFIQFGGVHPENIVQNHPPGALTLGPVFGTTAASPDPLVEHGTGADNNITTPSAMYDRTRVVGGARPDAPMNGVRGIPATAGARPDAPVWGPTPTPPASEPAGTNFVRPDVSGTARPPPPAPPPDEAPPGGIWHAGGSPSGPIIFNPNMSPSDMPTSGVGVSVHDSRQGPPQRTGAPPNVGITPSSVDNPAARNMPYPGQADPDGVYAPKPNRLAKDTGARPDLTARSTGTDADKPSKDAQPVSATRPTRTAIPSTPSSPGFVQVSAPNQNPGTGRGMLGQQGDGERQMTALDLSHLWGPNPPLSQRQAQAAPAPAPASASAPARRPDDDQYSVGTPDMSMVDFTGAAKGGPITQRVSRFANGGAIPTRPMMGFAGGGTAQSGAGGAYNSAAPPAIVDMPNATWVSPTSTTYVPSGQQPRMGANMRDLAVPTPDPALKGYLPWGFQGGQGAQSQANYASMTPDQQAWYNQQKANFQSQNNSYLYNPASFPGATPAAAPAAAPAATPAPAPVNPPSVQNITNYPATITDPTTTTVTGAQNLPNSIQAKSYDPNVDQQTGAGFADTSNTGGTDYSVGTDDLLKQNASGQISGKKNNDTTILSRKGGAIPTRPTLGFAAGGAAPMTGAQYMMQPSSTYVGPRAGGGWSGTPYEQLAPNQQAWADTTRTTLDNLRAGGQKDYAYWSGGGQGSTGPVDTSQYFNQFTAMPDAIWPAAPAPAAPTNPGAAPSAVNVPTVVPQVTDPTTTTVTGAQNLPSSIKAKSYDPNVDQQTGAGFANTDNVGGTDYSVGADDLLKTSDDGSTISGSNKTILSRKGGPITQRVNKYDDGGDVGPSAVGMPPGLGGQGAIPPIYFNSATYAPAGAPVGKGISQTNAATSVAGAIPSLPMALGGRVGFADGGSVDEATGEPIDYASGYGPQTGNARAAAPAPMQAPPPQADPYATATSPQDVHPDLPAWTPQVKDNDGNPSKGVIGAIAGGLHYLASQLGLSSDGQQGAIARDPATQQNRMSFVRGEGVPGAPMPDREDVQQIHNGVDPAGSLSAGMRTLAGMEAVRNYYLTQGEPDKADKMAASMMQYSVTISRGHGDEAVKAYYKGDLHAAVNELNQASDAVGDGTNFKARVSEDGKHVEVSNTDLNGNEVWSQKDVSPQAILGAAIHARDGSLAWHMYEAQAAKYDPATQQMIAERRQNRTWDHQQQVTQNNWQHQQDILDAKEKAKQDAAEEVAKNEVAVLTGAPQSAAAATNPVGNQPALPRPPTTPDQLTQLPAGGGAGAPSADLAGKPPMEAAQADTAPSGPSQGEGGYTASPLGGVPTAAPTATPTATAQSPDLAAPDAQTVAMEPSAPIPPPPSDPTKDPRFASLPATSQARVQAAYQSQYNAWRQQVVDQQKLEHEDRAAARSQGRLDQRETFTQGQENIRVAAQIAAKKESERAAEDHADRAPRPDVEVHKMFALEPDEKGQITGKQPADYYKDQAATMPDGTINPDQTFRDSHYNQEFSDRNQRMNMDSALVNGYRYTKDGQPAEIADALRGFAINSYTATATAVKPDSYGQRYAVTITRPSDKSTSTVILPRKDWENVLRMQQAKAAQADQNKADIAAPINNPYRAPPPSGESAGTPISQSLGWRRGGPIHRGGIPSQPTAA